MRSPWAVRILMMLAVVAHCLLAYQLQRTQTTALLGTFAILWVVFFFQLKWQQWSSGQIIAFGMVLRMVYLVSMPALSDDVFRYLWDGHLTLIGTSPFAQLPSEFMQQPRSQVFHQLLSLLNSPNYYSIYPPFMQALFAMAAKIGGNSIFGSIVALRVFILLVEFASLWLLQKLLRAWKLPIAGLALYALNPLVIAEFTGNLHTEAFMVFFLVASVWFLSRANLFLENVNLSEGMTTHGSSSSPPREGEWPQAEGVKYLTLSGVTLGLAIAVKLLPLMLLPLFIWPLGWRKAMVFGSIAVVTVVCTFLPFLTTEMLPNMATSAKLYYATFEFNASIYYLIRQVGFWVKGYNIIASTAVWLPRIVFVGILAVAFFHRQRSVRCLPLLFMFAFSIFYAMANTVHPWYVASIATFLPFVSVRYPLVLMVLLPLSYHAYASPQYHEQLWLVAIEYLPAYAWAFYELVLKKNSEAPTADARL